MGMISDKSRITISVVSHGHGKMVARLAAELCCFPEVDKIILTLNIPERLTIEAHPKIEIIENNEAKGFSSNHNSAFTRCETIYFCVVNPDIECPTNPFPILLESLADPEVAVAGPMLRNPQGEIEISARKFPTIKSLVSKFVRKAKPDYVIREGDEYFYPDWIAGMFMLFKSKDYISVGGFDDRYHLYYEDVDMCRRLGKINKKVLICPSTIAIHDARRYSHKYWKYRFFHIESMFRFLFGHLYRNR